MGVQSSGECAGYLVFGRPAVGPLAAARRFRLPTWALVASLHHRIADPGRMSVLTKPWRRPVDEIIATYEPLKERLERRNPLQGYFDGLLSRYLPDDLLVKVDRMSSAHGIEARVPLLDHRVVELAARIPARMKTDRRRTKTLLRKAMAHSLPAAVFDPAKRGFGLPPSYTRASELRGRVQSLARNSDLVEQIIDLSAASRWDGATSWRAMALATWIVRCHQQVKACRTGSSP